MSTSVEAVRRKPIIYNRALLGAMRTAIGPASVEPNPDLLKFTEKMVKAREARLRRAAAKRLKVKLKGPRNVAYADPDTEAIKGMQVKLANLLLKLRAPVEPGEPERRRRPSKKVAKLREAIRLATEKLKSKPLSIPKWPSKENSNSGIPIGYEDTRIKRKRKSIGKVSPPERRM